VSFGRANDQCTNERADAPHCEAGRHGDNRQRTHVSRRSRSFAGRCFYIAFTGGDGTLTQEKIVEVFRCALRGPRRHGSGVETQGAQLQATFGSNRLSRRQHLRNGPCSLKRTSTTLDRWAKTHPMSLPATSVFFLGVCDPLVFVRFNKRLKPAKLFVLFCIGDFCLTLFDHKL
jgi:hypothetical protein